MSGIPADKYASIKPDICRAGNTFLNVLWLLSKHMHASLRIFKDLPVWRAAAEPVALC